MRTSQRRRRHDPRPNKTADKPSCAFAPCKQPLSRRPTELADGLALKEPAPPTARRGIRPNNSGPPLSDTSSETRRISGKLAGAQRENASVLPELAANSRHFLISGITNPQFALVLSHLPARAARESRRRMTGRCLEVRSRSSLTVQTLPPREADHSVGGGAMLVPQAKEPRRSACRSRSSSGPGTVGWECRSVSR
jgi:hypothetical protein